MIQANELRIGNYVRYVSKDVIVIVNAIEMNNITVAGGYQRSRYRIPQRRMRPVVH